MPDLVHQGPSPVLADGVAGQRAHELAGQGHEDDRGQAQRVVVHLPARQDAAVDDGHLGADGQAGGRDEAQNEDPGVAPLLEEVLETGPQQGEMAPLLQKLLHVVPCFSVAATTRVAV